MKPEDIMPIPADIADRIRAEDAYQRTRYTKGNTLFYAYYTMISGDLCQVRVAVKYYREKQYMKQVAVHGLHQEKCLVRDIEYKYIAGYVIDWSPEKAGKRPSWNYGHEWEEAGSQYYRPFAIDVNLDYVVSLDAFRYSAVDLSGTDDTLLYLRTYESHPYIELLSKIGLGFLYEKTRILSTMEKEKGFRSFLCKNKALIDHGTHIAAIINAYRRGITLEDAQRTEVNKAAVRRMRSISVMLKGTDEYDRFVQYLSDQKISAGQYEDYLTACNALGVDMHDTKNRYPREFRRWHDIRTDEYASQQAQKDAKKRPEFVKRFSEVAGKYATLEFSAVDFACVIAKAPSELVREGSYLHHCVGRMGYDQKFVQEKSLIFFIRQSGDAATPYVTVEYSPTERKVLQCYGDHDSRPDDATMAFVQKQWLPYANRQLKKITA